MFSREQYRHLNSIWDGTFSSKSFSICSACGACCHNTDKTLFPREYDFLVSETGQMNTSWKSIGCLCYNLNKGIKPVICKIFPLRFKIDLEGNLELFKDFEESDYSINCKDLTFDEENYEKAHRYLTYLFSDIHNRIWYLMSLNSTKCGVDDEEFLKQLGKNDLNEVDLYRRSLLISFGFDLKEFEEFWKF
jgi:hypothetical protein